MASTAKAALKEKQHGSPRLAPRATAASAARAARIATNRNLAMASAKSSTDRISPAGSNKAKSPTQRIRSRSNSTTEVQTRRDQDADIFIVDKEPGAIPSEPPEEITEAIVPSTGTRTPSSRPSTPNKKAPSTPSHPAQKPKTPIKAATNIPKPTTPRRPTTPNHDMKSPNQHSQRTKSATSKASVLAKKSSNTGLPKTPTVLLTPLPSNAVSVENDLESQESGDLMTIYANKEKQFKKLKKELDIKQQSVLEMFDCLKDLRDRMVQEGVSGARENLQRDIVVFNVADWTAEELAQLCVNTTTPEDASELIKSIVSFDESAALEIDGKLKRVPNQFADLCLQAFTSRQEIIDWIKDILNETEVGAGEAIHRISYFNKQGLELCEFLRELKQHADETVKTMATFSRHAIQEKSALIKVGESLLREIEKLRYSIQEQSDQLNQMLQMRNDAEGHEALRKELEEEKSAKQAMKEKLLLSESQSRQMRQRIAKMDQQLREAEASIASLTGTVKSLEDQFHQKEVKLEARARKLRDSLKTGEITVSQTSQQRDELRDQLQELQNQITNMKEKHKTELIGLNKELENVKKELEAETQDKNAEKKVRAATQQELQDSLQRIEELKAKIKEIETQPSQDLPTEREIQLYAELQATKECLRTTEEEMNAFKKEKLNFLETLTKISEADNKVGMQQKLAAELLSKEEMVGKLQSQIRELTKNVYLNEQKVVQYEMFLHDYLASNKAAGQNIVPEGGVPYDSLQQEVINLRMNLLEAAHRNEELTDTLTQKEQQLDTQIKTSKAQATVIKVREELINMLKNKETEQSRELTAVQKDLEQRMRLVDEVNHQIAAKADEIQELFATLEGKQQQIHRLEKIVVALEDQQRRSQAQRTRHEEKIAALEHELTALVNRDKKFLFF